MSYWVELHCDVNLTGVCRNERNQYPMGPLSSTRVAGTLEGLRKLGEAARKIGWRRMLSRNNDWVCPECQAALKANP